MERFFCKNSDVRGKKIELTDPLQAHHIKDVLRMKTGSEVMIVDEQGNEYLSEIESLTPKIITLKIRLKQDNNPEIKPRITVACAIPKKSKMDDIIDKLTQLGAYKIIPMETERVIVLLKGDKKQARIKRWEKIAQAASRQSQRKTVPVIDDVKNLKQVLSESGGYELKLIPALTQQRNTLGSLLEGRSPRSVIVLIGPEGDFTEEELSAAIKAGFLPVSLGELILRVETAAIAAVSFIRLHENS